MNNFIPVNFIPQMKWNKILEKLKLPKLTQKEI